MENVPGWGQACELEASTSNADNTAQAKDITGLEAAIHTHQSLYESMCQSYTEVHSTSKKLLYQLDHLVQVCNSHSHVMSAASAVNSSSDTSDGRKHVRG